ncbi:hypothetical protein CW304_22365 [Bacillus sp. UFRGS-B20]|nr:hypothetical protein CW304_22365 [Bacillus sp. UFRGS-B20]
MACVIRDPQLILILLFSFFLQNFQRSSLVTPTQNTFYPLSLCTVSHLKQAIMLDSYNDDNEMLKFSYSFLSSFYDWVTRLSQSSF